MRRGKAGVVGLLCLALIAATSVGAAVADDREGEEWDERAPYVDAGLDQEVTLGDEVFLDGEGTWDDQGDVVSQEWAIETPDGSTIEPDCATCWFTSFQPDEPGEYAATLSVEDGEGFENSDTLYVEVEPLEPDAFDDTSGGSGGGCFAANVGGNDNDDVCDVHGQITDLQTSDTGVDYYVVDGEDAGIASDYSELRRSSDGDYLVDPITLEDEMRPLYETHVDNNEKPAKGDTADTNGGTAGSVEAMSYGSGSEDYSDQVGIL